TLPKVTPPATMPVFSARPSDQEIFAARVFEEPLLPMGGATNDSENLALVGAIKAYLAAPDREDASAFEAFLTQHPTSAWRAALLTDLGVVYRRTGYFSKALGAWSEAWRLAQVETEPRAQAIADVALSHLATLNARLGRKDELVALLDQGQQRSVHGSA